MGKKIRPIYLTAAVLSFAVLVGCAKTSAKISDSPTTETTVETVTAGGGGNILIAYFAVAENSDVDAVSSASVNVADGEAKGLVRILAEDIQKRTGGDLFSIQTSVDYPGDIDALIDYAAEEQDGNVRPELQRTIWLRSFICKFRTMNISTAVGFIIITAAETYYLFQSTL